MQFPSRIRPRFSLRWMLIAMTIFALTFGYYANAIRKNVVAIKQLRGRNVLLIDRFIDPIGPNFVYNALYRNPHLWSTAISNNLIIDQFTGWFGVVGFTRAWVAGVEITTDDAHYLAQVPFLNTLRLTNCKFPTEAVERIVEHGGLQAIILEGTSITPAGLATLHERLPNCRIEILPYDRSSATHWQR